MNPGHLEYFSDQTVHKEELIPEDLASLSTLHLYPETTRLPDASLETRQ